MDRKLDSLDPRFKPIAIAILARAAEAHIPVMIVNTRRTQAEQDQAIRTGHSWIQHSKHLDGLAIDIVPYSVFDSAHLGSTKLDWDAEDPVWYTLGRLGETEGAVWGGHFRDMGHFEFKDG